MSHSDHEWAKEQIAAHLAGGLPAEDRARLEAHVTACAECIAEIDAARRFERSMDGLFAPIRPAVGLEERVIRALRLKPARKPFGVVHRILLTAAAVLVLGGVGYVFSEMEKGPMSLLDGIGKAARPYESDFASHPPGDENVENHPDSSGYPVSGGISLDLGRFAPSDLTIDGAYSERHQNSPYYKFRGNFSADEKELADQEEGRRAIKDKDYTWSWVDAPKVQPPPTPAAVPARPSPPPMRAPAKIPAPPEMERPADRPNLRAQPAQGFSYSYRDDKPAAGPGRADYFRPDDAAGKFNDGERAEMGKEVILVKEELKSAPAPVTPKPKPEPDAAVQDPAPVKRHVIRTGDMEFEVESFDTAVVTIEKIVLEQKGEVVTVNSEKLPNGKVRGSVVVRCPPDRLDFLVPMLRALGDLKSQRITSQDVTKQYTDLESRLRAARTMEERLLKIIKEGQGAIKDLLLAEKELGEWRTKIETMEGEKRYYDNLIGRSTLTITLNEKEIRAPSGITQTEKVQMGIEVEEVEKAHEAALKAVADAKGRVTRSELKQHAAGQFNAIVHFEIAPDAAPTLRDRLKQLGNVARLDVNRLMQTEGGTGRAGDVRVKVNDTVFEVSIYNLANVQPRETVVVALACADVEAARKAIVDRVNQEGGRVVSSHLNRQKNDQSTGTVTFEIRVAQAEALLDVVKAAGEVMRLTVTENPDAQNVTKSKRGFSVTLSAMGLVAPRETTVLALAADDVPAAYRALLDAALAAGARIGTSQLDQNDPANVMGTLDFEVRRGPDHEMKVRAAIAQAGETYSSTSSRAQDVENVVDTKTRIQVTVRGLSAVQPRDTTTLQLAVKDVAAAHAALSEAVRKAKGWIAHSELNETDRKNVTAGLTFDVRREQVEAVAKAMADAGHVYTRSSARLPETVAAVDTKVRYQMTLLGLTRVPAAETVVLTVEVSRVEAAVKSLLAVVAESGGRTLRTIVQQDASGRDNSRVTLDVPLPASGAAAEKIRALGRTRGHTIQPNPQAPEGALAYSRFEVTLANEIIVGTDEGPWANIKKGFAVSLKAGSMALMLLMVGVCLVVPLGAAVWGGWRVYRKVKAKA